MPRNLSNTRKLQGLRAKSSAARFQRFFSKKWSIFGIFWSKCLLKKCAFKLLQCVLMRPKGLRSGLYAPTSPPSICHYLQNLVQYFKLAYFFSVELQFFVIVLTSIDSCTCKCNYRSFIQTTTGTYHIYYTIYCFQ